MDPQENKASNPATVVGSPLPLLSPESKSIMVPGEAMSSPEGPNDGEVPNRSAKKRRLLDDEDAQEHNPHRHSPLANLPFSKGDESPEDEGSDDDEDSKMERRARKRMLTQKDSSPRALHLSPETPKHFQNFERILFRSQSKNLASLRRLDEKYGDSIVVEHYKNGGGEVLHIFPENLPKMDKQEHRQFAAKCMELMFSEDKNGMAYYCFGIVHNGAQEQPNMLRYIAENYPKTEIVKEEFGHKRMAEVMTIGKYLDLVDKTLSHGSHRAGTMRNISLVGCEKAEEKGGYFEDVLKMLGKNPWLKEVLPWGKLSKYPGLEMSESDDGPIMWTCPGEQVVSISELQNTSGQVIQKKKRSVLDRLTLQSRNEKVREKLVEDRTGCHADMAGYFPDRHPVAAVGFVQSVEENGQYDLKDIVAFHAEDMDLVAEECGLYFHEEPKDQLMDPAFWADEAKLNQLRRMGIRFARIRLQAGDIYCIPRRVVHQFQTVLGCISVTWHLKYAKYYQSEGEQKDVAEGTANANAVPETEKPGNLKPRSRTGSPAPTHRKRLMKKSASPAPDTFIKEEPVTPTKPQKEEPKKVNKDEPEKTPAVKEEPLTKEPKNAEAKKEDVKAAPQAGNAQVSPPSVKIIIKPPQKVVASEPTPATAAAAKPAEPPQKPPKKMKKHWDDEEDEDMTSFLRLHKQPPPASQS